MTLEQKLKRSANDRAYYLLNRERILSRKREDYRADPEKFRARTQAYKQEIRAR